MMITFFIFFFQRCDAALSLLILVLPLPLTRWRATFEPLVFNELEQHPNKEHRTYLLTYSNSFNHHRPTGREASDSLVRLHQSLQ